MYIFQEKAKSSLLYDAYPFFPYTFHFYFNNSWLDVWLSSLK